MPSSSPSPSPPPFQPSYHLIFTVSWPDLHRWSVSEVGEFWQAVSDFCGIKWLERGSGKAYCPPGGSGGGDAVATGQVVTGTSREKERHRGAMTDARWFEGARLNFAHNLLPPATDDEAGTRFFFLFVVDACRQRCQETAVEACDERPSRFNLQRRSLYRGS